MRKALLTLFMLIATLAQAQTYMHVFTKDTEHQSFNVTDIDSIVFVRTEKGTPALPYTVPELLGACENLGADEFLNDGAEVCTKGVVTKIKETSTQWGNISYYIGETAMSSSQIYIYRGFLTNGAMITTGNEVHVGDTVVVSGKVKNYRGTTLEYDTGSNMLIHKPFNTTPDPAKMQAALMRLEFPVTKTDGNSRVILHEAQLNDLTGETGINYSTEWDMTIHAQRWSCYQMYASLLESNTIRAESGYPNDFFLPVEYHFDKDPYKGSGYDHGHICPSADRLASEESNAQTFFMTNMQPQTHSFNAGIWSRMESQVRNWANTFDTLYVCKGGTIDQEANIITYLMSETDTIPIPKYFFMAILGKKAQSYQAIAFWVEHQDGISSKIPLTNFVVNISQLEQYTGIDFFHNLPDETEQAVETQTVEDVKNAWGF